MKTQRRVVYHKVIESLREQISCGQLRAGDRLPTFKELRAQFDLNANSVSRALMELENEGLIVREQGRGTFVAQSAPRAKTGLIGFVPHISHDAYWTHLLQGVQSVVQNADYRVVLLPPHPEQWEEMDGVLIASHFVDQLSGQLPASLSCVALLVASRTRASVVADDAAGAALATRHLLELGHRRIAYLPAGRNELVERRWNGYRAALREAGVEPDQRWVRVVPGPQLPLTTYVEMGTAAMAQWLREDWDSLGCTALLAHNDGAAIGAMAALKEAGLRVPEEISVVGFDGTEISTVCSPPLTTIEVPLEEIGARGARLLLQTIGDAQTTVETEFTPVRLRERASTAPPIKRNALS